MQPHDTTPLKTCTKCGQALPLTAFYRDKSKRDGLHPKCKACHRAYHEANQERIAARMRAYVAANRETIRESKRAWWSANRERVRARQRAYKAANREHLSAQERARYAADPLTPEKVRAMNQRRRARIRRAEGAHGIADIRAQFDRQKGRCYWCGKKVGDTYHVDHIVPLSRGGSNWPENLVIACSTCNRSKGNKLPHEWSKGGRLL